MSIIKSKSRAASVHLIFNIGIFSILLFVLLKLWYPQPFFTSSGGWQGIKIVALVDIVLGPLLTLVIYNPDKPRKLLMTDILLIFILQIGAFVWGTWAVYQQRPLAITFWDSGFYTVPAKELKNQENYLARLKNFGETFPVFAYVDRVLSDEGQQKIIDAMKKYEGQPPFHIIDLFEPYQDSFDSILKHEVETEELNEYLALQPNAQNQLNEIINATAITQKDLHFIWLVSKYRNTLIVFDTTGVVLGYIIMPYKAKDEA